VNVAADPVRVGYTGAAAAWADDASLAYVPLARHLVAACPDPLPEAVALDAGAGTGAAAAALRDRGARVVAADLQEEMLRGSGWLTQRVVADVTALPFRTGTFDVVVAAFVLNHLARPALGLREIVRVCRPRGVVLASTFSADRAVAKGIVDDVARAHGWVVPDWYDTFRARAAGLSTVEQVADIAREAGLGDVSVNESVIDIGLDDPTRIARYRLGMPQLACFVRSLPEHRRRAHHDDVGAAIEASGGRLDPSVIELVGRASRDPSREAVGGGAAKRLGVLAGLDGE